MGRILREGMNGQDVVELQLRLRDVGFSPGALDGEFGPATEAAVLGFQHSRGLVPDGIVGPRTYTALELDVTLPSGSVFDQVTVRVVSKMFPFTPLDNIKRYNPFVLNSLDAALLDDQPMVLMALATIRAESEGFAPISERPSRFNTSPGGHPFDLYDNRLDLGNRGRPDGERYRGRGFIQLTGRFNYDLYSRELGLGDRLIHHPDEANEPEIAADLLACFLKDKEVRIKRALVDRDFRTARRLVNGGSHGLDRFVDCYTIGERYVHPRDM